MARGVNKVLLIGNLGGAPEVRYMPSGGCVTNVSVATSESWKDKTTGEMQDRTEWHRVVMFNRLAEIARDYLQKGSKVFIEGSIRTRKWQDKSGQDRYTTEIVANEMQMLDARGQVGGAPAGAPQQAYGPQEQPQAASAAAAAPAPAPEAAGGEDFDDDIPF